MKGIKGPKVVDQLSKNVSKEESARVIAEWLGNLIPPSSSARNDNLGEVLRVLS